MTRTRVARGVYRVFALSPDDIDVFQDHLTDPDAVIRRLLPFDVVCAMRERTPLSRNVIAGLPNLKLIASSGAGNASIDVSAAAEQGYRTFYEDTVSNIRKWLESR